MKNVMVATRNNTGIVSRRRRAMNRNMRLAVDANSSGQWPDEMARHAARVEKNSGRRMRGGPGLKFRLQAAPGHPRAGPRERATSSRTSARRSEEHTSGLPSLAYLLSRR